MNIKETITNILIFLGAAALAILTEVYPEVTSLEKFDLGWIPTILFLTIIIGNLIFIIIQQILKYIETA